MVSEIIVPQENSRHVSPEGLAAAVLLAFMTTAGLFYVNLGGAFLTAFVDGLGISREAAGYIVSANKYGAAFGALIATLGTRYLSWRKVAYFVLPGMIAIDLLSFQITSSEVLVGVRFLHGMIGGFLVGLGLGVIARTENPDSGYGMLLAVQYSFGSLGIFLVPKLVGTYGPGAAFGALICFSLITLVMVPFIPDYPPREKPSITPGKAKASRRRFLPLILALAAVFLFQATNMGVADYAFELGKDSGFEVSSLSNILSVANIISVSGALLVYVIGIKFGRTLPILLGVLTAMAFTFALHWSEIGWIYFVANTVTGITWAFCISYLLGLCATFDGHGQMAALGGFVSKMGLASGPFIAASVVGEGNFTLIINLAAVGLIVCALSALIPSIKMDRLDKLATEEKG
ncbi:MFS transporter [Emcibacter sp.]|uniref:MFS transporter n=1 Tax=Emcibacter sp. TaxID=1979954 RepID=UPI002AA70FA1|nr:MFS transporter [Emcibacter sp.]